MNAARFEAKKVASELVNVSPHDWAQACGHVRTEAVVVLIALLGIGATLALITILCVRALRREPDVHSTIMFGIFMPLFWLTWFIAIANDGAKNLATALYPQQAAAHYLKAFTEDRSH